jgi:hypothetical protein
MSAYAAHLRVYEPLAAFSAEEREQWGSALDDAGSTDPSSAVEIEHGAALRRLVTSRLQEPAAPAVLTRVEDGIPFICPLDLAWRCAEALAEFRAGLPEPLVDAFVPPRLAAEAAAMADSLAARAADRSPHVQTARWQVPLRWFVAFEPAERQLTLGPRAERYAAVVAPPAAGLARSLGYRTAMSRARRRVARALDVLRRTVEGPIVDAVEDLGRWLEEFHPHSLVELDYGGLVHLLDDDSLEADTSAADVSAALAALRKGDASGVAAAYERTIARWRPIAAVESAS